MYTVYLMLSLILLTTLQAPLAFAQSACPENRYGSAMVYDEANKRLILFGGAEWDDTPTFYNDTWAYVTRTNTWVKLNTPVKPPGRFNPGMVYVPGREVIILFGGHRLPDGSLSDMWLFDVKTDSWRELDPPNRPEARSCMGMAYDAKQGKVLVFGGRGASIPVSDTWAYDVELNAWTDMRPTTSPQPQYGVGMVYDSVNERVLLLEGHYVTQQGGVVRDGYNGGLYTFNWEAGMWRKIECSPPPGRYWYSTGYDSDRGRMIVFGGIRWISGYGNLYDETWIYDTKANTWTRYSAKGPEKRYISPMAYYPTYKVTILFGGADVIGEAPGGGDLRKYYQDTWALNATLAWSLKMANSTAPVKPAEDGDASRGIPAYPCVSILLGLGAAFLYFNWGKKRVMSKYFLTRAMSQIEKIHTRAFTK